MTLEQFTTNIVQACEDLKANIPDLIIKDVCKILGTSEILTEADSYTYSDWKILAENIDEEYRIQSTLQFIGMINGNPNKYI